MQLSSGMFLTFSKSVTSVRLKYNVQYVQSAEYNASHRAKKQHTFTTMSLLLIF